MGDEGGAAAATTGEEDDDYDDIEKMQAQLLAMEAEAAQLAEDGEGTAGSGSGSGEAKEGGAGAGADGSGAGTGEDGVNGGAGAEGAEKKEDEPSNELFIGNLEENVKPDMLKDYFSSCGEIDRITILVDQHTGRSKGHAYLTFSEEAGSQAVEMALALNDTEMPGNGKPLKVSRKRKNVPRFMLRGRGRGRGGYRGRGRGGYRGRGRGGFRGRGRGRYNPW